MRHRLTVVALTLLLAADVVLALAAFRGSRADSTAGPAAQPPVGATVSATTAGLPTRSRSPARTGSATTPATRSATGPTAATATPSTSAAVPLEVLVVGLDGQTAWRAGTGTCATGGASLAVTRDGGRTWTPLPLPVGSVSRIQPLGAANGFVFGAGTDCVLAEYDTTDGGATWAKAKDLTGSWSRRLDQPQEAVTPSLADSRPCAGAAVVDLSRTSAQQAQALCADGGLVSTTDGGTTWTGRAEVPGAVALASRLDGGRMVATVARVVADCNGVQIVQVPAAADASVLACVEAEVPERAGRVALSTPTGAGWLLVGTRTFTASADLRTWNAV